MKTFIAMLFLASSLQAQQTDKLLHASAGFVSSSFTTAILQHYNVKHSMLIGFGVGTCLGVGKELYDKISARGTAEPMDAIFTSGGAALGSVTVRISIQQKKKRPILDPIPEEPAITFK